VSNFWLAFRNNFECSVLNFKNWSFKIAGWLEAVL
jgi:hypothetical protein